MAARRSHPKGADRRSAIRPRIGPVQPTEPPVRSRARHRRAAPAVETGHGHGHGHSPATPAERRVRVLIAALLVPCAVATVAGLLLLAPTGPGPAADASPRIDGHITAAEETAAPTTRWPRAASP
ncbi:hypothetical protein BJF90_28770 [Pseudonocardia sp. CNS-004]|nr:hypothetical protein BJF90_28770 [Pseudonocardia sp. CNS-004]